MREIKFRAFDNGKFSFIEMKPSRWLQAIHELIDNEVNTLMAKIDQYTGLKDKNGKEIYEGDKLENAEGDRFIIEWARPNLDYCGFCCKSIETGDRSLFINKNFVNSEVVGNIYENPELLKDKN